MTGDAHTSLVGASLLHGNGSATIHYILSGGYSAEFFNEESMTQIIDGLLYTKDDEWIKVEGGTGVVGVTDYAQDSLSDIVYLELPEPGETFEAQSRFGVVESVKAAADLNIPVDGEVLEVNEALLDTPEVVNSDPYGAAWMIKIAIANPEQLAGLMDAAAYRAYCDERH